MRFRGPTALGNRAPRAMVCPTGRKRDRPGGLSYIATHRPTPLCVLGINLRGTIAETVNRGKIEVRPNTMWRYQEFLPLDDDCVRRIFDPAVVSALARLIA